MKKSNRFYVIIFFLLFSLTYFVISLLTYVNTEKIEDNYIKINAQISNIDKIKERDNEGALVETFYVYVDYIYENTEYNDIYLDDWNSNMKIGDSINIFINPNDPTNIEGNLSLAKWFFILSILCLILSVTITLIIIIKEKIHRKVNA